MKPSFFFNNRRRIVAELSDYPIVIAGHQLMQRTNDLAYEFQQEANFWWLTGIEEQGWQLVLHKEQSYLIAPIVKDIHRTFDGSLDWEVAKQISGVDHVLSSKEGMIFLRHLTQSYDHVYTLLTHPGAKHFQFQANPGPVRGRAFLRKYFNDVVDCRLELARLRAIKQPEEIEAIKRAIAVTVDAFEAIKPQLASFDHEHQIEAEFSYHIRNSGAKGHAYDPIIASGANACTLHYIKNNSKLNHSELVLLDIGAAYDGYAADITRTYSLGTASQRQKEVHAAVESAHQSIIALLRPGLSVKEYHEKVDEIMQEILRALGLLNDPQDYRRYFPHAISHGLGVDVHDSLGAPEVFLPGMVLTVEPGIYIPEEAIGVRIEDDILITETGYENLSAALPTNLF